MISYDDVYIQPRHSGVESRDDVSLETQFTRNHRIGCPVVASPMDTVVDAEMIQALDDEGATGIMHRFGSDEYENQISLQVGVMAEVTDVEPTINGPACASIGATGNFAANARNLWEFGADVILVDVAHGDHDLVKQALYTLQKEVYQLGDVEFDVIAGNVATAEGAFNLAQWGADAIRVGIGNGCFTADMGVKTTDGLKKIVDVEAGDEVLTHRNRWKEVMETRQKKPEEDLMVIDGIECTPNHEFYVVHEEDVDEVNEENIHEYAEWVRADELTENHYRVEDSFKTEKINYIERKETSETVYDLEVEDDHSYNIEGTVVHNSVCSTREKTGVGVGQITAIRQISQHLDEYHPNVPVIADGGIRKPGDAAKALAAGADTVMVGSILSGTDETPGELKARETDWPNRELYKEYRGSASQGVKGSDDYVEGVTRTVPYRGSVKRIISDLKDGLRSSFSYVGAQNVEEFQAKANLEEVSGSTAQMGQPHH